MNNPVVSLPAYGFKQFGSWWEKPLGDTMYYLAVNLIEKKVGIYPSNYHDHTGITIDFEPMNFQRIQNLYFALTGQELKPHEESENSDNS